MAQLIKYKDYNKANFETFDWVREDANEELKEKQIINIETLKNVIRFWYKEE